MMRDCRVDWNVAEKFQQNVTAVEFSMCKSQPLAFTIDHYAGKASLLWLYEYLGVVFCFDFLRFGVFMVLAKRLPSKTSPFVLYWI